MRRKADPEDLAGQDDSNAFERSMPRAQRRQALRVVGEHRSPAKRGHRPAARTVLVVQEVPERHRTLIRLPFRLELVRRERIPTEAHVSRSG